MTVDLHTPDEATLQILLHEYFPKDGLIYYSVETNTTLQNFTRRNMKVNRKLEDFLWLYERFSENSDLAGNIIPHLPVLASKDQERHMAQALGGAPEVAAKAKEDLKKRLHQLQKFLRRVAQVPHLRTDTNLQAFLEYEELAPRKSQGWFNFSSTANPKIDTDEAFQKLRQSNADYQKNITACLNNFTRVSKSSYTLADGMGALPEPLKALKDLDAQSSWTRSLAVFAEAFKTAKTRTTLRTASAEESLGELLADYTGLCSAVAAMHNRRLLLLQRAIGAKENRIKAEKKAVNNPAKQEEVKLLVGLEDSANHSFSASSSTACVEVVRCRNMRVADFRHALVAFAEKEIEGAQKEISCWQDVLDQLKCL